MGHCIRSLIACALLLLLCSAVSSSGQSTASSSVSPINPRIVELETEAELAASRGDDAGAVQRYQSILDIDSRTSATYYNLGVLYVRLRQNPKAVAILERGLQIDPGMHSPAAL